MKKKEPARKKEKITFKRLALRVCLVFLCLFALALLAAPPVVIQKMTQHRVHYRGAASSNPLQQIYEPEDFGLEAWTNTLHTSDGYRIWTSEVALPEGQRPKGVVIYLTGIEQPSVTYFYGHSKWMRDNGYASLLLEVRGHGQSSGERIGLGYEEIEDVRAAVDHIKSQELYEGVPIILHGVSMGGAAAINAAAYIDQVDGVIAMSAYSSVEAMIEEYMTNAGVPRLIQALERPVIRASLKFFYGNKIDRLRPEISIENLGSRPALLIASTGDTEVPSANTERIAANAPDQVEVWYRNSREHFIIADCDFINFEQDTEYCDRILTFLDELSSAAELREAAPDKETAFDQTTQRLEEKEIDTWKLY